MSIDALVELGESGTAIRVEICDNGCGKFSLARGGTIFLDEIGELSPAMQAKLLWVLQYKEFTPLGAKQVQTTDARIITATNVDLAAKVKIGSFREDLYYRLQ